MKSSVSSADGSSPAVYVTTRYEKRGASYLAMVVVAVIRL
jgi:hypothetical protein